MKKVNEVVVNVEVKRLGRPVNENSERQKRLSELNNKRELGLVKRGRPSKVVVTDEVAA